MPVTASYTPNSSTGNGVTTVFAYNFPILDEDDLLVTVDGVEQTSGYTVSGVGSPTGGSITFSVAPANGTTVLRARDVPYDRETDYQANGDLLEVTLDADLDRIVMQVQQLKEWLTRVPALALGSGLAGSISLPTPEAGKFWRWNLLGTNVEYVDAVYDNGTWTQSGTGAVERTVDSKLGDIAVTPEDFGAAGDGSTNDTAELQAAIDTGRPVYLTPGKTYLFGSDLVIDTNHQLFGGPGVLKPDGNCGVVVNGSALGVRLDVIVDSSTHTGWAIKVDTAHRTIVRAYLKDCYDGIYVTGANVCTLEWVYGACRHDGIKWYGTTSVRSDVLKIAFALLSMGAGRYGFDWDGNCHSLEVDYLGLVCGSSVSAANGYGFILRNTSGGTAPAIGRLNHIEVDYSGTHAIDITAGSDIDISVPYILGATGAGIRTGASINDYEVRVASGKSRGNTTYGIQSLGGVVLYDGSTDLSSNTSGKTSGSVWTMSERFALDANAYLAIVTSNPLLSFDSTDYLGYNRATNTLSAFIGGTAALAIDSTRATFTSRPRIPQSTVAALPAVHVVGDIYFATNGRKNGEGGGAGTGVLVFSDGTNWIAVDSGATVAA